MQETEPMVQETAGDRTSKTPPKKTATPSTETAATAANKTADTALSEGRIGRRTKKIERPA